MLALLWLVGSVITVLTLVVPYDVEVDATARFVVASLALGAAVFLWRAPQQTDAVLHGLLVAGALMIAFCTHLGAPDVEGVMFVLIVAYAFATFPARQAAPHLALTIVLLGVVLLTAPDEKTTAPWISFVMISGVAATTAFALASIFGVRERERVRAARDRLIARELQRALLPTRLPEVAGASLAAKYLPAADDADVGGDFYDAFVTPDGRLALCVGDVAGKGLAAARATGGLRSAMQAIALEDPAPGRVLGSMDRFAAGNAPMATLLLAVLDPRTGEIEWASAGHPPPLRLAADGTGAFLAGAPGVPLGTERAGNAEPAVHRATLGRGEGLLLFSDGLIERRGEGLDTGMRRLAEAAREAAGTSLPALLDALLPIVPRPLQDDVTALVVRRDPEPAPAREATARDAAAPGRDLGELARLGPTTA